MAAVDFATEQLTAAGAHASLLAIGHDFSVLETTLARCRPDVVLNLFEGLADSPYTEALVADLLERFGISFTGSSGRTLKLARNKLTAKQLMAKAGLPTPAWFVVNSPVICDVPFNWPVIAKPVHEDASIGIDQQSIAANRRQLAAKLREMTPRFGPGILVEQYIPGREFSVAMVEFPEPTIFPPIEFEFDMRGTGRWPILTYDAKWQPGSIDYEMSCAVYGADLPDDLHRQIDDLAFQAFQLFNCRHYARVDFRVSRDGQPYILDVNPNPDLSPTACFCGALRSAETAPGNWLVQLVQTAKQADPKQDRMNAE